MEYLLGVLMFDINLLNKPGIQIGDIKFVPTTIKTKNNIIDSNRKVKIEKNKINKNLYTIIFLAGIIISLFIFYKYSIGNSIPKKNISISLLMKMILDEKNIFYLEKANFKKNNGDLNLFIRSSSEETLYNKLELFNDYEFNAKASVDGDDFIIDIKEKIFTSDSIILDIYKLHDSIINFQGIESEIFNEKMIIICNYRNLLKLVEFLETSNQLSIYNFEISEIKDKKYYKFILG